MNPVDLGVLGAILLCALISLIMGFVRTILALSSWAGAALVTVWAAAAARGRIGGRGHGPLGRDPAGNRDKPVNFN